VRVLWLAPWFRSFAHIYGGGLVLAGHDVQVITSDKHPDPAPAVVEELVCPKRPYDKRWPQAFVEAERLYRRFRPQVVIAEEFTDPMFALLRRRMRPQWLVIHDASPHDETHELHGLRKFVAANGRRQATDILTFSEYVAGEVEKAEWNQPSIKVHRVKLLSELRDEDVPALRPRSERHDFVLMGRLRPYKNVEHVLRAWTAHVNGPQYRGDRLIVWSNAWGTKAPRRTEGLDSEAYGGSSVEWRQGGYRYSEIRDGELSGFKGNLCVYSEASQSAVQVLSAQLGVVPIVSNVGALPEYQASGLPILDPTDLEGLVDVLDQIANPDTATTLGQIARESYASTNSGGRVTKELAAMLEQSVDCIREETRRSVTWHPPFYRFQGADESVSPTCRVRTPTLPDFKL
jgi:glycosyltransferase involved in cell wall biosynthesis